MKDVLDAHGGQIAWYGGNSSVPSMGLLNSAMAQPYAGFGGGFLLEFPFAMAAAYLYQIVQNYPFVDGNKRSGPVAALLFFLYDIVIVPPKSPLDQSDSGNALGNYFNFHNNRALISLAKPIPGHVHSSSVRLQNVYQ